jgi:CheY-like chemotaxis protein
MSKVIVLDDNEEMRNVLKEIVSFMGYDVQAYGQVEPFIESVAHQSPDCVIVDAMLGQGANGLDVIERVRTLPGTQISRYILMSANPALQQISPRLDEREITFLPKPCHYEDLEVALARN